MEVIPEANVGVIAGGSISSLAVFSVILGLIGFMCGWKIRSSFTRRTGRESVMVQNLNTLGPTVPVRILFLFFFMLMEFNWYNVMACLKKRLSYFKPHYTLENIW